MPDDDEPITIDTRRGGGASRLPRRRAAEEPDQVPTDPVRGNASGGRSTAPHSGSAPAGPVGDSTRMMPAGQVEYPQDRGSGPGRPGGPRGPQRPGPRPGPGGPGGPQSARPGGGAPRKRKRIWLRVLVVIVLIIAVWASLLVWAGLAAWGKVTKVDAFPSGNRPASGKGTNTLLVGSDSRAGMSSAQGRELGTGGSNVSAGAPHTDSIMILHKGSGAPTLVSVQRDSWVAIPGHGHGKINSAFTYGGPKLLVQTVEQATGLRMDNYMEIGFGGFAGVVDAVGGVKMCLPQAVKDADAHIDLPKGCQNLNGKNALGYVRSRHAFATGDLARAEHQRQFLGALMKKVASPSNLLLPWKLKNVGSSAAKGVAVDNTMSPIRALKIMWTLKSITASGVSVQVPVANPNYFVDGQSTVQWDKQRALQLFDDLRNDRPVTAKSSS